MAGSKQTFRGEIVQRACKKHRELPTLTLAKKIFADNPEIFRTLAGVRAMVRDYRAESNRSGEHRLIKTYPQTTPKSLAPFKLPDSHLHKKEPIVLPKACKKILLLSDIHIPYQDNQAIEAAVEYGIQQGCDTVYLNGDILDFWGVSFHEKDPRKRPRMKEELEMGREFFGWLRHKFPTAKIYFIPGNHEQRLTRYMVAKAPELLDIDHFSLPSVLELHKFNITFLDHKSKVYFGKLLVEHGDKMRGTGGVNPARTLLLKFKRPVICGHFHRTSQANSKVYDGEMQMAWSTGMLCEDEPDYMEVNEHNTGAAIVEVLPNGNFKVDNFQIINGKVY
jgi:UDP-2,3-diacylglucosamine pyrophosphatase LpxH